MPVMTAAPVGVTDEQRLSWSRCLGRPSFPHRKVVQARALLLAADGVPTNEVARRCGTTRHVGAGVAAAFRGRRG